MSCGYACVGCGKCKGISRPILVTGHCPACGFDNEESAVRCARCGRFLPQPPGYAPQQAKRENIRKDAI